MFTGIIEGVGSIRAIKKKGDGAEAEIMCDFDLGDTSIGDSISVNGCCLTITSKLGRAFWADISPETMSLTTLELLKAGDPVNLERALKVGGRLGGHIVQGHVDGIGEVIEIKDESSSIEYTIKIPSNLSRYIVDKGSVAVDGVSLTVNSVSKDTFKVMIIPHTQLKSTFQRMMKGNKVNLEVDIIGKYVEKLAFLDSDQFSHKGSKITEEFLRKHGF